MNLISLKQQIEHIIGCSIAEHQWTIEQWKNRKAPKVKHKSSDTLHVENIQSNSYLIPIVMQEKKVTVWEIIFSDAPFRAVSFDDTDTDTDTDTFVIRQKIDEAESQQIENFNSLKAHQDHRGVAHLSEEKRIDQVYQLLKLLLPSVIGLELEQPVNAADESELAARELGQWIVRQLSSRNPAEAIPDETVLRQRLNISMIPFLLIVDSLQTGNLQLKDLEKLLSSYFDRELLLIPLHDNEWLILANHNLLEDEEQNDSSAPGREIYSEQEDTEEDVLTAFALGLHELVASEWVGVFHISVARPLIPADRLVQTVAQLRETIHLGKLFHVSDHIHLPWEMRLESLLYRIPVEERQRFVDSAEDHSHLFGDEETVSTLETFFKMDCNVSETAKQLYIHRNTLLYRLDKIKQETQLDVRRFEDAVLMRLTLLLYKVTKS